MKISGPGSFKFSFEKKTHSDENRRSLRYSKSVDAPPVVCQLLFSKPKVNSDLVKIGLIDEAQIVKEIMDGECNDCVMTFLILLNANTWQS